MNPAVKTAYNRIIRARSVPVPMNPAVKTAYNRIIRALKHLTPENQKRVLRATCILMDIPMPATLTA